MKRKFLLFTVLVSLTPVLLFAQWKKDLLVTPPDTDVLLLQQRPTLQTPAAWPVAPTKIPQQPIWSGRSATFLGPVGHADYHIIRDKHTGLPIRIEGAVDYPLRSLRSASAKDHAFSYLETLGEILQIENPREEFVLMEETTDELDQTHLLFQQTWKGLEVWGQQIRVHRRNGAIDLMHGRYWPTPRHLKAEPVFTQVQAERMALQHLAAREQVQPFDKNMAFLAGGQQIQNTKLIVFVPKGTTKPRLAWYTEVAAHALSRWAYFLDAQTGETLNRYQLVCTFHPNLEPGHSHAPPAFPAIVRPEIKGNQSLFDGPVTAQAVDLLGVTRTLGTYEIGNEYLMLDVSRPMFNAQQSTIPDNPVGGILTLDAREARSNQEQIEFFYVASQNNTWNDRAAVSAHYNAGICYDYFRTVFGRNSINGSGGTIYSVVNIANEDGQGLDNAFWNGRFMFYGNGEQAFEPLAAALDVGAHEMTHGVIQNTANLEYQDEPGAINESFADVFGVMVDRDDWQLAEDVVRRSVFPTGAMRDMSDPNNGGSRLGDPGWQPAHVDEQYFGDLDNGGVHINSGIPNRAFYLFATQVGLDRAEQVYYRALSTYLTRTSQFFDLRMAIMQAADDLYGPTEVNAAASSFDAVGITGDNPGNEPNEPTDVPVNDGQQFVAMIGSNGFGLYLTDPQGNAIQGANPLVSEEIISPPSISDDGSVIVFVNGSNQLRYIIIDWAQSQVVDNDVLSNENIWRRASISKDAARIAVVTQEENDQILIYDFASQNQQVYELFNPTFTEGISSDEVQFADAMEWDITSQYLIYDAFNEVSGFGGGYTFWDIGVLEVWNNQTENFASGNIEKLFTQLPVGIVVGNPSVAKNSPNVIAFDYWDQNNNEFAVLGYDLQTNQIATLYNNLVIGYPTYSTDDEVILFNAVDLNNTPVIAIMPLADDKINAAEAPSIFVSNRQWAVWFATGSRVITDLDEAAEADLYLEAFPNPVADVLTIRSVFSSAGTVRISILSALGQVVHYVEEEVGSGPWMYEIPMGDLAPGMYRVQLEAGNEVGIVNVVR